MSDTAPTPKRAYFSDDSAPVAGVSSISAARLAAAPSRAAWQAAVNNLNRCKAAVKASGAAHSRAEAAYLEARPEPQLIEDVLTRYPSSAEEFETRVASIDADYKRQAELVKQETGFAEAERAWETACTVEARAADALLLCPAPDIAAVAHKIEVAKSQRMELVDIDPVLVDLRRLAGKA